jgi:hypothetical protein
VASVLTFFLEQEHRDEYEFLNHIERVTADETNQWMYTHSLNKLMKHNLMLSACRDADVSCFLGQKSSGPQFQKFTAEHQKSA